jgi:GNAT superfamily N-acetyltransferase
MTSLILRPWRPTDLEPCMAIWRAASEVGHPFLSRNDLEADANLVRRVFMPSTDITVAERLGEAAGFIGLAGGFIGALFVAPRHHRQGIGARLLADAARRHRRLAVEVYAANAAARRFYSARGFVETLCHLTDDRGRRLPLIRMERDAGSMPDTTARQAA